MFFGSKKIRRLDFDKHGVLCDEEKMEKGKQVEFSNVSSEKTTCLDIVINVHNRGDKEPAHNFKLLAKIPSSEVWFTIAYLSGSFKFEPFQFKTSFSHFAIEPQQDCKCTILVSMC